MDEIQGVCSHCGDGCTFPGQAPLWVWSLEPDPEGKPGFAFGGGLQRNLVLVQRAFAFVRETW